jgi:peptidyl-prolyl cis-trans isomerase SurA
MRRLTYLALIFATFCAVISPASATISILAIVNGEPVTSYELEQRIALLTDATNIEVNDSNRQRIRDDALQMLIDETLKDQSALRANPNVRSVALAKANEFIEATFATETKTGAKVLRDRGIDPATVKSKYFTDLVWADFLRSTYRDKFAVIAEKIDAELIRLEKNASQPQIKLSEIVLTPGPNRSIEQTLALANEMVVAVRKGANFNAIAQQYSVAGSAKQGGRIGWVVISRLPELFSEAVISIADGAVSDPISLDGTIYIFRREAERKKGLADESQTRISLVRAIFPLPTNATNADRLEAAARIERDTETINSCEEMQALNDSYGSQTASKLDEIVLADLAPQMQKLVKELEDKQPSEPIAFDEGVATMMVCKRSKPKLNLPTRKEIEQTMLDKLFGTLSERYLLRLRRNAIIDLRG